MNRTAIGRNWAGNHDIVADRVLAPESIDEARDVVRRAESIRALGTRHSFNTLVDSPGDLVAMTRIPTEIRVDPEAATVSVTAGTSYGVLARILESEGWALHNMGSLPHISVAGAVSTGTHGSGNGNGALATAVRGLELIGPDGELRRIGPGDPTLAGSVVALGALGVVTRVELAVQPSYRLRQDVYRDVPWDALLADVDGVTGAAYSVSILTDWAGDTIGQVWLKTHVDDGDESVPPRFLDLDATAADPNPALTDMTGRPGPWLDRLPHFRLDSTPSTGSEIQTEYFIDRADGGAALAEIRPLAPLLRDELIISELRTVAADELWLSPAYRRDSLGIHFTWRNHTDRVRPLVREIERRLEPFAPRPHWAKAFSGADAPVGPRYPRFEDFVALVAQSDPEGKFGNEFLRSTVGLPGGHTSRSA